MSNRLPTDGSPLSENGALQRHPGNDPLDDPDIDSLDGESDELPVSYPGLDPDDE